MLITALLVRYLYTKAINGGKLIKVNFPLSTNYLAINCEQIYILAAKPLFTEYTAVVSLCISVKSSVVVIIV